MISRFCFGGMVCQWSYRFARLRSDFLGGQIVHPQNIEFRFKPWKRGFDLLSVFFKRRVKFYEAFGV